MHLLTWLLPSLLPILLPFLLLLLSSTIQGQQRCQIFSGDIDEDVLKVRKNDVMMAVGKHGGTVEVGSHLRSHFDSFMLPHVIFQVYDVKDDENYMLVEVMGDLSSVVLVSSAEVESGNWSSPQGRQSFSLEDGDDDDELFYVAYLFILPEGHTIDLKDKWNKLSIFDLFHDRLDHFLFEVGMCKSSLKAYFWSKFVEKGSDDNIAIKKDSSQNNNSMMVMILGVGVVVAVVVAIAGVAVVVNKRPESETNVRANAEVGRQGVYRQENVDYIENQV